MEQCESEEVPMPLRLLIGILGVSWSSNAGAQPLDSADIIAFMADSNVSWVQRQHSFNAMFNDPDTRDQAFLSLRTVLDQESIEVSDKREIIRQALNYTVSGIHLEILSPDQAINFVSRLAQDDLLRPIDVEHIVYVYAMCNEAMPDAVLTRLIEQAAVMPHQVAMQDMFAIADRTSNAKQVQTWVENVSADKSTLTWSSRIQLLIALTGTSVTSSQVANASHRVIQGLSAIDGPEARVTPGRIARIRLLTDLVDLLDTDGWRAVNTSELWGKADDSLHAALALRAMRNHGFEQELVAHIWAELDRPSQALLGTTIAASSNEGSEWFSRWIPGSCVP